MKRCIIYARIGGSASEVNNGLLQAQLTELRAAAKDLGLEVMAELPSSAIWHTQSGKTNKRANVPCFEARVWMAPLKASAFVTNSYFVSTVGGAPLSVIKQYIENQKNV